MRKRFIFYTLFLLLILLVVCGFRFAFPDPAEVTITAVSGTLPLEFRITHDNIVGFNSILVYDASQERVLWYASLKGWCGKVIKYGELPSGFRGIDGANTSAVQHHPDNAAPAPIPVGKEFHVALSYDAPKSILNVQGKGAGGGNQVIVAYRTLDDGSIVEMTPPQDLLDGLDYFVTRRKDLKQKVSEKQGATP